VGQELEVRRLILLFGDINMNEGKQQIDSDFLIKAALTNLRVPKVFGLTNRRDYGDDQHTSLMIGQSNKDFYDIALKALQLYGQEVFVYPKINLQARITLKCNSKCRFCIEKYGWAQSNEPESLAYADRLEESIQILQEQGIDPSVTITGGEPCTNISKLREVLLVLQRRGITKYNLNTNGTLLLQNPELIEMLKGKLPYLNISLHHWDLQKSQEIMRVKNGLGMNEVAVLLDKLGGGKYGNLPRVRLQCVLLDSYVYNRRTICEYLNQARAIGIDNVAFRGLSKLSCGNYENSKIIPMQGVLDSLAKSVLSGQPTNWDFVCQNIADWYCYEDWKYLDKKTGSWIDVHFNFSNMANLRMYELAERTAGKRYAREFVLFEDGVFSSGWNKDLGFLKK
jgi:molybdenum cofactor biosynthesis enzyme MoaA